MVTGHTNVINCDGFDVFIAAHVNIVKHANNDAFDVEISGEGSTKTKGQDQESSKRSFEEQEQDVVDIAPANALAKYDEKHGVKRRASSLTTLDKPSKKSLADLMREWDERDGRNALKEQKRREEQKRRDEQQQQNSTTTGGWYSCKTNKERKEWLG